MTTLDAVAVPARSRRSTARPAAITAAVCLLAGGTVALVADAAALSDHTRGAGALSEALTGLAFLAGAVALTVLTPVHGWRRMLWALAPFGLAVGGLTMVGVPIMGGEPPTWLFLLGVVPTFVGLIAAGVLGSRRVWPWWTGLALALFLPIMFLVPFNSIPMAAVWICVALAQRQRPGRTGDRATRRMRMAYSLLFSLPGTPTIYYGEEIGLGEDTSQDGRMAVRVPLQWTDGKNGGFSSAPPRKLIQPVLSDGQGPPQVNVAAQRRDPDSLFNFVHALITTRRTCPELGWGSFHVIEQDLDQVLVHECRLEESSVFAVHNFAEEGCEIEFSLGRSRAGVTVVDIFADQPVEADSRGTIKLALEAYDHKWLRLQPDEPLLP